MPGPRPLSPAPGAVVPPSPRKSRGAAPGAPRAHHVTQPSAQPHTPRAGLAPASPGVSRSVVSGAVGVVATARCGLSLTWPPAEFTPRPPHALVTAPRSLHFLSLAVVLTGARARSLSLSQPRSDPGLRLARSASWSPYGRLCRSSNSETVRFCHRFPYLFLQTTF